MRERTLGSSELRVSVVGLGCNAFGWRLDEAASRSVIDAAFHAGITFFDTAESYGEGRSESFLGKTLAGRREQFVIATKFGWGKGFGDNEIARGAPAYVRTALERSLRRLGTDYVDLYQYHRPDGITPIGETLAALDELVREGKVRAIGSSNMSAAPDSRSRQSLGRERARTLRLRPEQAQPAGARRRCGADPSL